MTFNSIKDYLPNLSVGEAVVFMPFNSIKDYRNAGLERPSSALGCFQFHQGLSRPDPDSQMPGDIEAFNSIKDYQ